MDKFNMKKYVGITYPRVLSSKFILKLWKRSMCSRRVHLFDEVLSSGESWEGNHYLHCDACGMEVHIKSIIPVTY